MKNWYWIALVMALMAAPLAGRLTSAQEAAKASSLQKSYKVEVDGTKEWVDTKIDVRGGTKLKITAEGKVTYPKKNKSFGPEGIKRGFAERHP